MQINSITNSQQKTQQKQQAFGAFKITQPINEVRPIIKRAQDIKIGLYLPEDIAKHLDDHAYGRKGNNSFTKLLDQAELKRIEIALDGHVLTGGEKDEMLKDVREMTVEKAIDRAKKILKNVVEFPLDVIKRAVGEAEEAQQGMSKNDRIVYEARRAIETAKESSNHHFDAQHRQQKILSAHGIPFEMTYLSE